MDGEPGPGRQPQQDVLRGRSLVAELFPPPDLGPFCFPAQTLGPQHPLIKKQGKITMNALETRGPRE